MSMCNVSAPKPTREQITHTPTHMNINTHLQRSLFTFRSVHSIVLLSMIRTDLFALIIHHFFLWILIPKGMKASRVEMEGKSCPNYEQDTSLA